jgi:hypothetical protein
MNSRYDLQGSFHPRLEILEERVLLSVCLVDRLTDVGVGEKMAGDLRYCITKAQDDDTIQFGVKGTINLTRALPDLTRSISIEGPGANLLSVRRNTGGEYRIFTISGTPTVMISGLTITDGRAPEGGGIYVGGGTVSIIGTILSGNRAIGVYPGAARGGGIHVANGAVTVQDSTLSNNVAVDRDGGPGGTAYGGGLSVASGIVEVRASTFDRNWAVGGNGGLDYEDGGYACGGGLSVGSAAIVAIHASTLSTNYALGGRGGQVTSTFGDPGNGGWASGGSICVDGTVNVAVREHGGSRRSRLRARNGQWWSGFGGGISSYGSTNVLNSTITFNRAIDGYRAYLSCGGGIRNGGGTLHARNSILAGNTSSANGPDLSGSLASSGHNLIGNPSGGSGFEETDLLDVDPLLGPLQDNGGPTQTMALLRGSPAIDSGDSTDAPDWDQRGEGFPRIVGKAIDIGAYEVQDDGEAPGRGRSSGRAADSLTPPVAVSLLAREDLGGSSTSAGRPTVPATLSVADQPRPIAVAARPGRDQLPDPALVSAQIRAATTPLRLRDRLFAHLAEGWSRVFVADFPTEPWV